jgi:predicted acetyltransferase
VYELHGRVEGYAVYNIGGPWGVAESERFVTVLDLVATTPEAEAALWQFLCGIDLTRRIVHETVPNDLELPWRLRDPRQMRTTSLRDWLWLRPLDVPALLSARTYERAGRVVLDVRDGMRPDGDAAGRFVIEGGPEGATCARTTASADLSLDVATLGSITLGGITASELGRAGRIAEETSGGLVAADRLFATERAPHNFTWF